MVLSKRSGPVLKLFLALLIPLQHASTVDGTSLLHWQSPSRSLLQSTASVPHVAGFNSSYQANIYRTPYTTGPANLVNEVCLLRVDYCSCHSALSGL